MDTHLLKASVVFIAIGAPGCAAVADIIAADPFNYPVGSSLVGQAGGIGFAGAWQGSPVAGPSIAAGSLSFTDAPPSSGNSVLLNEGLGGNAVRQLSSPLNSGATEFWGAVLLSPGGFGPNFNGFVFELFDTTGATAGVVVNTQGFVVISYGNGSTVVQDFADTPLPGTGITQLLLWHAEPLGSQTRYELWVSPTDDLGAPDASILAPSSTFARVLVESLAFPGTPTTFDELRIATSPNDVFVPTPGVGVASLLGVLAAFGRRQRRDRVVAF
jgi:hypothetical protein